MIPMRKIVLFMIAALTLTGMPIAYGWLAASRGGWERAAVLFHLWGGVFFLAIFPLYAWDHVSTHRRWLSRVRQVTASGLVQLVTGALVALSGVVILLYGEHAWRVLRDFHHWVGYPLLLALGAHFLASKKW